LVRARQGNAKDEAWSKGKKGYDGGGKNAGKPGRGRHKTFEKTSVVTWRKTVRIGVNKNGQRKKKTRGEKQETKPKFGKTMNIARNL